MNLLGVLILSLIQYSYWIVLAAALFGGEELIIFFAILAGHGVLKIFRVGLIGIAGIFVADCFWFLFARTKMFDKLKSHIHKYKAYKHTNKFIVKLSHKNNFIYLLTTKFIYGFRILSVMKVARRKTPFWEFILSDIAAIGLWSAIMLPLGWVIGKYSFSSLNSFEGINKVILIAILSIVIIYIIESFVKNKIQK